MGLNYPAGISSSHPHFHELYRPDTCPDCGAEAGDEVYCQRCGAVLDPGEADAIEREADYDRQLDQQREMGLER